MLGNKNHRKVLDALLEKDCQLADQQDALTALKQTNTALRQEQMWQGLRPNVEDLREYICSHNTLRERLTVLYGYSSRPALHPDFIGWIRRKLKRAVRDEKPLTPALRPIADLVYPKKGSAEEMEEIKERRKKLGLEVRCRHCHQWFKKGSVLLVHRKRCCKDPLATFKARSDCLLRGVPKVDARPGHYYCVLCGWSAATKEETLLHMQYQHSRAQLQRFGVELLARPLEEL